MIGNSHWTKALVVLAAVSACLNQSSPSLAADLKHGEETFKKAGCFSCHPGGGNILVPSATLKGEKFAKEYPHDADIEKVIRNGITATPMPPFSQKRLPDADLPDLIAYIRSLTPQPAGAKSAKPEALKKAAPAAAKLKS